MSKRALVTGGNKGIGFEVTKQLLEKGYEVIIVARDFPSFDLKHNNITAIEYDLENVTGLSTLMNKIWPVDILVNNAGFLQPKYTYNNYPQEERMYSDKIEMLTEN